MLLSEAATIFAECFDPITDTMTGRYLIPSMVCSKSMKAQEFRGMYCAILTTMNLKTRKGQVKIIEKQCERFWMDISELLAK